jgi:hypothetical protein
MHGVSGSCEIQTCWKSLPKFYNVGKKLKEKYERSVRIAGRSKRKLRPKTSKRHRQARFYVATPNKTTLATF